MRPALWPMPNLGMATALIKTQVAEKTTAKEIWDLLKDSYGQPSVGSAHTELKKLLATTIPSNSHPAPAL